MHIGILQTGHVAEELIPEHGDYDTMFQSFLEGRGLTFTNYPVVDMVFPEGPDECEGWLITGSRHGAYEDHPWIAPLEQLIRAAYARAVPMVGICFGHQIIAQALGGKVEKFPGGWAVGPQVYDFEGIGPLTVNAWHQDQVTEKPTGSRVIASNDFCANAALVYGDKALTIQPHPEIRAPYMRGLIEVRGPGVVPAERLEQALEHVDDPLDQDRVAEMIADFFLQHEGRHG